MFSATETLRKKFEGDGVIAAATKQFIESSDVGRSMSAEWVEEQRRVMEENMYACSMEAYNKQEIIRKMRAALTERCGEDLAGQLASDKNFKHFPSSVLMEVLVGVLTTPSLSQSTEPHIVSEQWKKFLDPFRTKVRQVLLEEIRKEDLEAAQSPFSKVESLKFSVK